MMFIKINTTILLIKGTYFLIRWDQLYGSNYVQKKLYGSNDSITSWIMFNHKLFNFKSK